MPFLLATLLGVALWMVADEAEREYRQLSARIATARMAAARGEGHEQVAALRRQLDATQLERAELTRRLLTNEPVQMIRAKMIFDLRQMCEATGATACAVRLADDTLGRPLGSASAAAQSNSGMPATLADLGIQKTRAIVSGSFERMEPAQLSRLLNEDAGAFWRVKGLLVRGSTFELDVERHLITSAR